MPGALLPGGAGRQAPVLLLLALQVAEWATKHRASAPACLDAEPLRESLSICRDSLAEATTCSSELVDHVRLARQEARTEEEESTQYPAGLPLLGAACSALSAVAHLVHLFRACCCRRYLRDAAGDLHRRAEAEDLGEVHFGLRRRRRGGGMVV